MSEINPTGICYLGGSGGSTKYTCAVFHPVHSWILSRPKHKSTMIIRDYMASKVVARISLAATLSAAAASAGLVSISRVEDDDDNSDQVQTIYVGFVGGSYVEVNYWVQMNMWGMAAAFSNMIGSTSCGSSTGSEGQMDSRGPLDALLYAEQMQKLNLAVPEECMLVVMEQAALLLNGPLAHGGAENGAVWAMAAPAAKSKGFSAALPFYLHSIKAIRSARRPHLAVVLGCKDGGLLLWQRFAVQCGSCDTPNTLATAHTSAITALTVLSLVESSHDLQSNKDEMTILQLLVGSASGSISRVEVCMTSPSSSSLPVAAATAPRDDVGLPDSKDKMESAPTATLRSVVKYVLRGVHKSAVGSIIVIAKGSQFLSMCPTDGISIRDAQDGILINFIPWKGSNLGAAVSDGAEPIGVAVYPSFSHDSKKGFDSMLRVFTSKSHQLEIGLDSIASDVLLPRLLLHRDWIPAVADGKQGTKKRTVDADDFRLKHCVAIDDDGGDNFSIVSSETAGQSIKTMFSSSAFRVYAATPHPIYPRTVAYATNAGLLIIDEPLSGKGAPKPVMQNWQTSRSQFCGTLFEVDCARGSIVEVSVRGDATSQTGFGDDSGSVHRSSASVTGRVFCLPPKAAAPLWLAVSPCGKVLACANQAEVFLFATSSFAPIPLPALPAKVAGSISGGIVWNSLLGSGGTVPELCLVTAMGNQLLAIVLDPHDLSATASISILPLTGSQGDIGVVGSYAALFGGPMLAAAAASAAGSAASDHVYLVAISSDRQAKALHRFQLRSGSVPQDLLGGWAPTNDALVLLAPQQEELSVCACRPRNRLSDGQGEGTCEVEFSAWSFSLRLATARSPSERAAASSQSRWSFAFAKVDKVLVCDGLYLYVLEMARTTAGSGASGFSPVCCVVLQRQVALCSFAREVLTSRVRYSGAGLLLLPLGLTENSSVASAEDDRCWEVMVYAGDELMLCRWVSR